MKLTPGVNFINILLSTFMLPEPKSVKWQCWLDCFFAHLGSTCVKAVSRTLMKLTPGFNFINVLSTAFTLLGPKSVWLLDWILTLLGPTSVKAVGWTLMKLTAGRSFIEPMGCWDWPLHNRVSPYELCFSSFFFIFWCKLECV